MIDLFAVFVLVSVWCLIGALVVRRALARGEVVDVRVTPRSPEADAELVQWYEQTAARLRAAGHEGEARAFEDELQRQLLRK